MIFSILYWRIGVLLFVLHHIIKLHYDLGFRKVSRVLYYSPIGSSISYTTNGKAVTFYFRVIITQLNIYMNRILFGTRIFAHNFYVWSY
jgi:hypothetical protein